MKGWSGLHSDTMQLHKTASRSEESVEGESWAVSWLDFFTCLVILKFSKPAVHVFYMGNTKLLFDGKSKKTHTELIACTNSIVIWSLLRGGANMSLARTGRKQATATKLGIYSKYSPRSSIPFLAHSSNFYKPLKKKKFWNLSVQPGLRGSNDFLVGRKMSNFQLFFQSREQMIVRRGRIRRIGWVIKTLEAQMRHFILGCKCSVSLGIVVQEQDPLCDLRGVFPSKCPSIAPAEMSNTTCW